MNELNELFLKYQNILEKTNKYLEDFLTNFPELDLSSDIPSQITKDKLKRLEYMVPKLNLNNNEITMVKDAFSYYYRNSDLNLSDLIIQDENYENFIQFIKNIYLKALKYKKDETLRIEKEQEKYKGLLNSIQKIKELMQSETEINIELLVNYLKELPLTRDSILEITTISLEKNVRLYQKLKVTKEVEEKEEMPLTEEVVVDPDFDYKMALNIYPQKLNDFINKLERDDNHQNEKYETLARLVILRDKLNEVKQDYEFSMEDAEYFKNDIPDILHRIARLVTDIDDTIDSYLNSLPDIEVEESDKPAIRDLIILSPSLKDLDIFKKGVCSSIISKNLGKLIHSLRYDEVLYGMPTWFDAPTQVMKLKAPRTTGGTPRIFYQLLDKDKVVVLLLGIEGKNDYNYFKQSVEGRIKGSEYSTLVKSLRLSSTKPDEASPYNDQMTNREYLEELLKYYRQQESEFLTKFETECYQNPINAR